MILCFDVGECLRLDDGHDAIVWPSHDFAGSVSTVTDQMTPGEGMENALRNRTRTRFARQPLSSS